MTYNWTVYTLDELYTISSGLSKKREEFGFGYPFLTFKEVFHNPFVPNSLPELANTTDKERENCSIKHGDVFLTRTSEKLEELGLSSVALRDYPAATFNGFTKRLRPNEKCVEVLIPEYVAFYLRSNEFRNQVTSFASMTTRASLNNEMISKLKIKVPPLAIQKQIAEIMVNLLLKVETNKKSIHLLEQIAQTLFKNWFIDFEFPNDEGLPYKSNSGKIVTSELGVIPDGWKPTKIGEEAKIIRGASPRPIQDFMSDKGRPWVKITDANASVSCFITKTKEYIIDAGISKSRTVEPNTLILSNSATPGIPKFMDILASVHDGWLIFSDYKSVSKEFMYLYLIHERESILSMSNGSVFRNLKTDILKNYKLVVPGESVLAKFQHVVEPLFLQVKSLIHELEQLEILRDTLLPKLLSGEIEIPDEGAVDLCV